MRKRLTDRFVRTVKATDKQTDYWDQSLTGFGLRVSPKGKKTFQVFYRHHRLQRRMTLAPLGVLTLAEARKLAKQKLGEAARGSDPAAIKHANRDAETFGAFAKDYIRHYAKPNKKSWTEDQRIIEKELLPYWKSRKAKEITRRDVHDLVNRIAERAPIMANRTLTTIRQIFAYASQGGGPDTNPAQGVKKPRAEQQRDRVLEIPEIRTLCEAFAADGSTSATILRLQLLTAQRVGEIRRMRVADIDLDAGWWTIQSDVAKNKRIHRVPLSPQVQEILRPLLAFTKREWIFPSVSDRRRPICYATLHYGLRRIAEAADIEEWRSHDLRRTAATHLTANGVSRLTVDKILNHVDRKVIGVYDRYDYSNEKRLALEMWGRKVAAIAAGEELDRNVVAFNASRR